MRAHLISHFLILLALYMPTGVRAQQPLTPSFTYQGQLEWNGSLVTGSADMIFTLYDAATAGSVIGSPMIFDGGAGTSVTVESGVFVVDLDFGVEALNGDRRWMHIQVRYPSGSGSYSALGPRQELTGSPYALQTRGIFVDGAHRVGLGTDTPEWKLDILDNQAVIRLVSTISPNGSVLELKGNSSSTTLGAINFNDAANSYPGQISYGSTTLNFRAEGVGSTFVSKDGLYAFGSGQTKDNATLRGYNFNPNQGMAGYFINISNFATTHMQNNGTGEVLWMEKPSAGNFLVATDGSDWKFWVDSAGVTHTKVLQILGGSDLSEQFDVSTGELELAAGMTVCIDPEAEGRLRVSREAYDHRVAGIVSGAGGVNPGMLMGQKGSVADGEHPVALTGRVYCWVDASHGAVKPGDLLTTSTTPGHAMRVADPRRGQGAILGKAMGRLDSGQGLVLVLVGLQ